MDEVEQYTFEECLSDIYARGEFRHWDVCGRSYVQVQIGSEGDCVKVQKSNLSLVEAVRELHQVALDYPVKSNEPELL